MFKGKLLFLYQPDNYVPVYSWRHLKHFIAELNINGTFQSEADIQRVLMEYRNTWPKLAEQSVHLYARLIFVENDDMPREITVGNYTNPFNPSTIIKYALPHDGHVMLSVYNASGQRVSVLENREQQAGHYAVTCNATNMPSGLYFYTLKADGKSETSKMMLIK